LQKSLYYAGLTGYNAGKKTTKVHFYGQSVVYSQLPSQNIPVSCTCGTLIPVDIIEYRNSKWQID
jgi:hypothetical protein